VRDWLPILLTPVASLAIAWLGYRQATRAKHIDATASPYSELARRVVELEKADEEKAKRIDRLEAMLTDEKRTNRVLSDDLAAVVRYLTQLRDDLRAGRSPSPIPTSLRDVIPWQWDVQDSEAGPDAGAPTPKETPNA
jgi:uncharacterized coiled-coil protein SlyX